MARLLASASKRACSAEARAARSASSRLLRAASIALAIGDVYQRHHAAQDLRCVVEQRRGGAQKGLHGPTADGQGHFAAGRGVAAKRGQHRMLVIVAFGLKREGVEEMAAQHASAGHRARRAAGAHDHAVHVANDDRFGALLQNRVRQALRGDDLLILLLLRQISHDHRQAGLFPGAVSGHGQVHRAFVAERIAQHELARSSASARALQQRAQQVILAVDHELSQRLADHSFQRRRPPSPQMRRSNTG